MLLGGRLLHHQPDQSCHLAKYPPSVGPAVVATTADISQHQNQQLLLLGFLFLAERLALRRAGDGCKAASSSQEAAAYPGDYGAHNNGDDHHQHHMIDFAFFSSSLGFQ